MEHGWQNPTIRTLIRIADALDVPIIRLFEKPSSGRRGAGAQRNDGSFEGSTQHSVAGPSTESLVPEAHVGRLQRQMEVLSVPPRRARRV